MGRKILAGPFLGLDIKKEHTSGFSFLQQTTLHKFHLQTQQIFYADKKDFLRLHSALLDFFGSSVSLIGLFSVIKIWRHLHLPVSNIPDSGQYRLNFF